MSTNTGTIMTLANSIIGVSVLAMPFCFKQCGIILSIVMLIASSLLSRLACHFLLKSAVMARRRTFEFLAFHTFGWTGKFAVEVFIIGFLMGTCIAFFVVMGDLGPAIVAKIVGASNTEALRPSVLIGLAVFVVLPLGMLKNVDSLSSVSMATIGFYICLVVKVIGESLPHLLAGDWYENVHLWRPAGILQCIPIFSMALFCQTQLFEIYESMHNASLDRMNFVIRAACNICTGVYICVGFFGYIAFCTQQFTGNVLMSFTPSIGSEIIKLGFVLSVAVSFPLAIFPCRASLYSLLFKRITVPHHEGVGSHIPEARFKCLTVVIISVALVIGLLIPNIELVLGIVGSTIGVLICVMFPAAAFICMSTKSSNDRLLAQVLLFVGALILVLGTYATLNSPNESNQRIEINVNGFVPPVNINKEPHIEKVDNSLADIPPKLESKEEANVLLAKKDKKEAAEDDTKLQLAPQKEMNVDLNRADKRQEPPVPVEPIGDLVQVPSIASVVKEKKVDVQVPINNLENNKVIIKEEKKEKDIVKTELEIKEPKTVEQIHQDAINKEEEELAEAEKTVDAAGDSKKEEILRKLEKHEEQQMKILQKQQEILEALQEHQERDLLKEQKENADHLKQQKENADKNVNENSNISQINERETLVQKVNQNPKQLDNPVINQDDHPNPKQSENKIYRQKESMIIGKNNERPIQKENEINISQKVEQKIEPQQPVINVVEKQVLEPEKKKQDLLQQIANGELNKEAVYLPPKESISVEKSYQPINNFEENNEPNIAEVKESFHVADPKLENKPDKEGPIPPRLIERLSQPLPLQMNNKKSVPKAIEEKPQNSMNEINAMRREILQEPIATPTPLIEGEGKSVSKRPENVEQEIHDREKRDVEEVEKISMLLNSKEISNQSYNVANETGIVLNNQNCPLSEKVNKGNVQSENIAYEKGNTILNLTENNDKNKMTENVQSPLPLQQELKQNPDTFENTAQLAPNLEDKLIPSSLANSSVQIREKGDKILNNSINPLKSNNNYEAIIDMTMIKTPRHLSDPEMKSNNADLSVLKQNVLSPDTKPMKRDLKSIYVQEEKSPNNRNEG